jgi:hypothetical protein
MADSVAVEVWDAPVLTSPLLPVQTPAAVILAPRRLLNETHPVSVVAAPVL